MSIAKTLNYLNNVTLTIKTALGLHDKSKLCIILFLFAIEMYTKSP